MISLLQLPLTGVFNRLTMSVCRATIDTQVHGDDDDDGDDAS